MKTDEWIAGKLEIKKERQMECQKSRKKERYTDGQLLNQKERQIDRQINSQKTRKKERQKMDCQKNRKKNRFLKKLDISSPSRLDQGQINISWPDNNKLVVKCLHIFYLFSINSLYKLIFIQHQLKFSVLPVVFQTHQKLFSRKRHFVSKWLKLRFDR